MAEEWVKKSDVIRAIENVPEFKFVIDDSYFHKLNLSPTRALRAIIRMTKTKAIERVQALPSKKVVDTAEIV